MNRQTFINTFGSIYEHSPWVAETLFEQGVDEGSLNLDKMVSKMASIVDRASPEKQLALLRAHPDLAGKLAKQETLTEASTREQAGAGLDACTEEEFAEFQSLNQTYKEKFEFPFIIAVKGWHRTQILDVFRTRLQNDTGTERQEALAQVHNIARFRLEDYFQQVT